MSVSSVVCLKTLCDKVAQIERDNQREEAERKKVSVGVNTDSTEEEEEEEEEEREEEEDSSECPTLVERLHDLSPLEPEPQEPLEPQEPQETGLHQVDVHLPNGDLSDSDSPASPASDEKFIKQHKKSRNLLIDQIKQLNGVEVETPHANSKSCSFNLKDPPQPTSLLSRLRLDGESLSSMSASPDIFHLRAPLVSWENFLTPSLSEESTLAEF